MERRDSTARGNAICVFEVTVGFALSFHFETFKNVEHQSILIPPQLLGIWETIGRSKRATCES
jgi:hypothetical protein